MDTTLIDLEARIYFWAYGPLSQNDEFVSWSTPFFRTKNVFIINKEPTNIFKIRTKFGIGSPVTVEKDVREIHYLDKMLSRNR